MRIEYPVAMLLIDLTVDGKSVSEYGQFYLRTDSNVSIAKLLHERGYWDPEFDLGEDPAMIEANAEIQVLDWVLYGLCRGFHRHYDGFRQPSSVGNHVLGMTEIRQKFLKAKFCVVGSDMALWEVTQQWQVNLERKRVSI